MFELLGRWLRPGLLLSGMGLLVGGAALAYMEVFEPVPVVWALPLLGIAVGLIAGAGAFVGLHQRLALQAPRLAMTTTILASLTMVATLVTAAPVLAAMAQGALPGGIAVLGFPVAVLGFMATVSLVSIAAFITEVLPRPAAGALVLATALTLVLLLYVLATGEVSAVLMVAVLVVWGLALTWSSRVVPQEA